MGNETMSYGTVVCPFCRKEFVSEAEMKSHMEKHLKNKKTMKGGSLRNLNNSEW
jgi:uncharacterized Zn finger protein (UPF0148 family)